MDFEAPLCLPRVLRCRTKEDQGLPETEPLESTNTMGKQLQIMPTLSSAELELLRRCQLFCRSFSVDNDKVESTYAKEQSSAESHV